MSDMKRSLYICATFIGLLTAFGVGQTLFNQTLINQSLFNNTTAAQSRGGSQAPIFVVDPFWPKPLPNHWVLGSVTGVAVDSQDHIWITHRGADSLGNNEKGAILNPPTGCCVPAPQVLEFDQAGNLVSHWGGPGEGFDWPQSTGGIAIDHKGNIWIAAAGQAEATAGRGTRRNAGGAQTSGRSRPQVLARRQIHVADRTRRQS